MKYEKQIDFDSKNTQTIILDYVVPNSTILEFGPASGRLTKILKEQMGCKVYIVEIDIEAGKLAAEYAEMYVFGDILDFVWYERYREIRFDYILFADVIEHLRNVTEVFLKSRELLKENGEIVFSTPNIAHNSVIINLLRNRFDYTKTGLLDNTHLHFYTRESIENLLKETNLFAHRICSTRSLVGQNEIPVKYDNLDPHIASLLKRRKGAELYQYLYIVGKKPSEKVDDKIEYYTDYEKLSLFLYNESGEILNTTELVLRGSMNVYFAEIEVDSNAEKIRLDPIIYGDCVVKIKASDDVCVFDSSNAVYRNEDLFVFKDSDAQVFYSLNYHKKKSITFEVEYFDYGKRIFDVTVDCLENALAQKKELEIKNNRSRLEEIIIGLQADVLLYREFVEKLPFRWLFCIFCKRRNRSDLQTEKKQ